MRRPYGKLALAWLALFAAQAGAVDLTKIDRSLRKEPVYQSKHPQYCLLVFGPEARVRAWVVLDGDTLYLDRSANGDLTDPGNCIGRYRPEVTRDAEIVRDFLLEGASRPGGAGREPMFSVLPGVTKVRITQRLPWDVPADAYDERFWREQRTAVEVDSAGAYDQVAFVAFAARPQDAPILHFSGPMRVSLVQGREPVELRIGETVEWTAHLTTPGLGGTVMTVGLPGRLKSARPVADVECPPRRSGEAPIRFHVELTEPC
jgi:hypothetical protein